MANRRKNTTYRNFPLLAVAMGDSLTKNYTTQVNVADFWPTRLQAKLSDAGIYTRFANCGDSGNNTGEMIDRKIAMIRNGPLTLAVIFGGVNDPAEGASSLGASTNLIGDTRIITTGGYANLEIGEHVTAGANSYLVTGYYAPDAAILISPPLVADIPDATPLKHATDLNVAALGQYAIDHGATHVAIVGAQYLNYASNAGDTLSTDYANYVPVRAAQAAAAVALAAANPSKNIVWVDLHAYLKALISGGTVTQGNDVAWHVDVENQHLNATGEQYVADAIYAAITAAGWIQELA